VDGIAVDDLVFPAAATLTELIKNLKEKGIRLVLADEDEHVFTELEQPEPISFLGKDAIFNTSADAIQDFRLNAGVIRTNLDSTNQSLWYTH
jgi:hypothetical protein